MLAVVVAGPGLRTFGEIQVQPAIPLASRELDLLPMSHLLPCSRLALALAASGALLLSGCDQGQQMAQQAAQQAASSLGDSAKTAVGGAGEAALSTAAGPVLSLLRQGEADLKQGNLAAASQAMGGFTALWSTATPLIKPLAGERWPALEQAATTLQQTFSNGTPTAAEATAAIQGLMGPLSALVAR